MSYQEYEVPHHHHEEATFSDLMVEQIRNTPWLLISYCSICTGWQMLQSTGESIVSHDRTRDGLTSVWHWAHAVPPCEELPKASSPTKSEIVWPSRSVVSASSPWQVRQSWLAMPAG